METHSLHKNLLIMILESLQGYWSLASGFLVLVKQTNDKNFIEKLYQMIKTEITNINSKQEKERVFAQIQKVYAQQRSEAELLSQDGKEADALLDSLFRNT